mmetsp:Transcript_93642/g.208369  ORF Transcript_93642/g.208369 Transcript_93642/m.208369 type:complete len:117 (-) Transcript_93642:221-571(-)
MFGGAVASGSRGSPEPGAAEQLSSRAMGKSLSACDWRYDIMFEDCTTDNLTLQRVQEALDPEAILCPLREHVEPSHGVMYVFWIGKIRRARQDPLCIALPCRSVALGSCGGLWTRC